RTLPLRELWLTEAGIPGLTDRSAPSQTLEVRHFRLAGRIPYGDLAVQRHGRALLRRDADHLTWLGVGVLTLGGDGIDVAELQIIESVFNLTDILADQAIGNGAALRAFVQGDGDSTVLSYLGAADRILGRDRALGLLVAVLF